jgi:two-component system chemotaxis response regulator CheB
MKPIRVLVVDDSLTVRRRLCEVLAADPELDVAAEAGDGQQAVVLCRELRPDVITLDMSLPVQSGVEATEQIMADCPTPILIVSASTNRGDLYRTYDALAAGAVDVLEKPRGDEEDGAWEANFLATVKLVSRIKVITHPRARLARLRAGTPPPPPAPAAQARGAQPNGVEVVALGASTGGPAAVLDILRALPAPFPVPLLVVIHIDEPFGTALAAWLDDQTPHRVFHARHGESLTSLTGSVAMAPPGRHMVIRDGHVVLTSDPERHFCRPSIDVLFESLARDRGPLTTACLLTGMGRDGAAGLLEIKRQGGATIAQDEASSIVYGMPREAVILGAADRVLPLAEIGPTLRALPGLARGGSR